MRDSWRSLCFSLALALLVGEALVRLVASQSVDGETWVSSALLRPYRLPTVSVPRSLKHYAESNEIRLQFDGELGWSPPPGRSFEGGRYRYNAAGIRDTREFGPFPKSGTLRVMLFGDSFVHGDDVNGEDTLGWHLERLLRESGIEAEVLNAGVSAFGIDQAYLRWKSIGTSFHPDVVICGFQPENIKRGLNIHRYFYTHRSDEIPFTKPRFELQGQELALLNSPTIPLESLSAFISTFAAQPLSKKEHFYSPADFADAWYYRSRLLGFISSFVRTSNKYVYEAEERAYYDPGSEASHLARATIEAFQSGVERAGAAFVLLYIPKLRHLAASLDHQELPYARLLAELSSHFWLIDPRSELGSKAEGKLSNLYAGEVHFSSRGNEAAASALIPALRQLRSRDRTLGSDAKK